MPAASLAARLCLTTGRGSGNALSNELLRPPGRIFFCPLRRVPVRQLDEAGAGSIT